jgi:NDP-sugar pyrophosphorylase family protein
MKAIILAGGKGTRLRPLTNDIPKALIPIGKKTLTDLVIDILNKYNIKDIILSIAYKKEKIKEYFKEKNISYIEEPKPLGTAGPLIILNNQNKQLDETFFVINGDNLFNVNLKDMLEFHKKNKATVTIGLSKVKDPRSYGVAILEDNKIKEFIEKPDNPPTNYINSGYYIMEPEVFDIIKGKEKAMLEKDLFPLLAEQGKLFGFKSDKQWFDTGTFERYEQVKKEWKLD